MAWAAVIGGGVSLAGGLLSANAQKKSAKAAGEAAQFKPFAVQGAGANVGFRQGPNGQNLIDVQLGNQQQDINNALLNNAGNAFLFGGPNAGLAETISGQTTGTIPQAFAQQQNNLGNVLTPEAALQAARQFQRIGAQQNEFGQRGLNAAFQGPTAADLTAQAQNRGLGLLDTAAPTSFNDLAAQRLSALRAQARPAEQRAVDTKFNNLFSTGRLGTTGGARGIEALATAQNQADLARQINSLDFAQGQSNAERQFAVQQQNLGAGLLGQAFGGISQDQARAQGLGSLGAGQFGAQNATTAAQLGAFQTADQAQLSAGQQRLSNAQQLFGFGQNIIQTNLNRAGQQLGLSQTINEQALNSARLGASVGQAQSAAAANAGQLALQNGAGTSPFGSLAQGLGSGISSGNGENFGKVVGKVGSFFSGLFGGGG